MMRWKIETKTGECTEGDQGTADAVVVFSITRRKDSVNYACVTADSHDDDDEAWKPVVVDDLFRIMTILAENIAEDDSAVLWQRAVAAHIVQAMMEIEKQEEKDEGEEEEEEEEEEGALARFGVSDDEVIIEFSEPTMTVVYDAERAKQVGTVLLSLAEEAEKWIPAESETN